MLTPLYFLAFLRASVTMILNSQHRAAGCCRSCSLLSRGDSVKRGFLEEKYRRQLKVGCSGVQHQVRACHSRSLSMSSAFSCLPSPGKTCKQLVSPLRTLPFWQSWLKLASEFRSFIRERETGTPMARSQKSCFSRKLGWKKKKMVV